MHELDHRLKYFNQEELNFVDQMVPLLEQEGLTKESERLNNCGRKYNSFTCTGDHDHGHVEFVFPYSCELRICPRCAKKRGKEVRKQASEILKGVNRTKTNKFSLLTLTLKKCNDQRLTPEKLHNFNKNVRKLINFFYPKKKNCGAISVLEIGSNLNIHAHILVYGSFISQNIISKKWFEITGDSYIVDVRSVLDQSNAIKYITKYIFKPPSFPNMDHYTDFLKALRGVRRLHKYGIFYGFKIEVRETCKCPYCGASIKYLSKVDYKNIEYFDVYWDIIKQKEEKLKNV